MAGSQWPATEGVRPWRGRGGHERGCRGAAGTVSLLFTDLEGSTRLWDTYGPAIGDALVQHDSLLRACVERSGGRVFKHTGDGICAVFPTGAQALQAAVDAQRSVITHDWGVVDPFRVRMALHTGSAERRDDDHFGPALNRCARLLGVAAGRQVLCTRLPTRPPATRGMPPPRPPGRKYDQQRPRLRRPRSPRRPMTAGDLHVDP